MMIMTTIILTMMTTKKDDDDIDDDEDYDNDAKNDDDDDDDDDVFKKLGSSVIGHGDVEIGEYRNSNFSSRTRISTREGHGTSLPGIL